MERQVLVCVCLIGVLMVHLCNGVEITEDWIIQRLAQLSNKESAQDSLIQTLQQQLVVQDTTIKSLQHDLQQQTLLSNQKQAEMEALLHQVEQSTKQQDKLDNQVYDLQQQLSKSQHTHADLQQQIHDLEDRSCQCDQNTHVQEVLQQDIHPKTLKTSQKPTNEVDNVAVPAGQAHDNNSVTSVKTTATEEHKALHKVNKGPHMFNEEQYKVNLAQQIVNQGPHRVNKGLHKVNQGPHRVNKGQLKVSKAPHTPMNGPAADIASEAEGPEILTNDSTVESKRSVMPQDMAIARRLLIDDSDETSIQPVAFHALSGDAVVDAGDNVLFNTVLINIGNDYHAEHGLFTAPVAGLYMFSVTMTALNQQDSTHIEASLLQNGNTIGAIYARGDDGHRDQGSVTVVTQLQVDDEVWVRMLCCDGHAISGYGYTSFTGVLLYQL